MGKPVTITVSHDLGTEAAKARIENGFTQFGERLGFGVAINRNWDEDTLNFDAAALGQTIRGNLKVFPQNVVITVELPLLLAGMAETIKGKLQKESTLLLDKK